MIKRLATFLFVCALIGAVATAAGLAWWSARPLALSGAPLEFTIPAGSGAQGAGRAAAAAGVPMPPWLFTLLARVTGKAARLKAGTYAVGAGATPLSLLDKIEAGDVLQFALVVPEGWSFRQMRAAIEADTNLKPTQKGVPEADLMRAIGAADSPAEGAFFPDTYLFARGTADVEVYRRAWRTQQKRLAEAWAGRAADLPLRSPYEALILASLIEKETGHSEDRPMIAAVFINRLRVGMLLQTDPTVIYGLGDRYDGNLRKRDLGADTPYNTYTRAGLPPTPIALPGAASLAAALHPAHSTALYFVARGDGSSAFSDNLNAHNHAVNQYQRGRP